jgi:hypothetical protein
MTWRSSLWARWLGWTALYALVIFGIFGVIQILGLRSAEIDPGTAVRVMGLALAVLAFTVGARFRSWSWGVGPLAALVLFAVVRGTLLWTEELGSNSSLWFLFLSVWLWIVGGVLSLFGLAGVWWGRRRHAADPRPERARSEADASTEQRR